MRFIVVLALFFTIKQGYAFKLTEEKCIEYGLGRNWYCEKEEAKENSNAGSITPQDILNSSMPPESKAAALNDLWEFSRKIAVITGKKEDLEQFLNVQNIIASLGVDFARNIQRINDTNPKYALSESYYKNISDKAISDVEKEALLKDAATRYGIAFIYSSTCSYCVREYPIILALRSLYGFRILGVSVNADYFQDLDENITSSGLNIKALPTVMLLDKEHPARIFIAQGITTLDDLENKIVSRIKEREHEKSKG